MEEDEKLQETGEFVFGERVLMTGEEARSKLRWHRYAGAMLTGFSLLAGIAPQILN